MDKINDYNKAIARGDNPAHLDESGTRYFEPYLSELFAALGLYDITDAPMVVHGLNGWVCLETEPQMDTDLPDRQAGRHGWIRKGKK